MWCVVGAPLYLVAFWLAAPLNWIGVWPWGWLWRRRRLSPSVLLEPPTCADILLRDCAGGLSVGELQEFLEDPLSDPQVRQDEKSRPATVEHIKQLRDRVESTIGADLSERLDRVKHDLTQKSDQTDARLAQLEHESAAAQKGINRKLDALMELLGSRGESCGF